MLGHEHLELRHQLRVPPARKVGLDSVLERAEPQFLQAADLRLSERLK